MPRFVILTHDHPFLHWDLLLEHGDACRTWRLLDSPERARDQISAEAIADHRLFYLDYEGPVSGDRGTVTQWDRGTFEWQTNENGLCEIVAVGSRWQGNVRLVHISGDTWTLFRD